MPQKIIAKDTSEFFTKALELASTPDLDFDLQLKDTFTIKINDTQWNDATIIDYRVATVALSLQRDILGIFNDVTGSSIALKDLPEHKELIANIIVEEGCIKISFKEINNILNSFNKMQKSSKKSLILITGLLVLGYITPPVAESYKDYKIADLKHKEFLIEHNEKENDAIKESSKILINNSRTPKRISELISDDATVSFNSGPAIRGRVFKGIYGAPQEETDLTFYIDGAYTITGCDFQKYTVTLKTGKHKFTASMSKLSMEEREYLSALASESIKNKTTKQLDFQLQIHFINAKKFNVTIDAIGPKRTNIVTIKEAKERALYSFIPNKQKQQTAQLTLNLI